MVFDSDMHWELVEGLIQVGDQLNTQISQQAAPERISALRSINDALTQLAAYSDRQTRQPGLTKTEGDLYHHHRKKAGQEIARFNSLKKFALQ